MKITFDLQIDDAEKYEILYSINQDKIKFEKFISDMSLSVAEDPFSYDIVIKDKIFGFITDGMVDKEKKRILFYGVDDLNIITHEWAHVAFPSPNCERHSEGLAIYIQLQLTTFHFHGFDSPLDLVNSYLFSKNREKIRSLLDYIKNPNNFYDSRWGRMLLSRALSAEFVIYLIDKYGIKKYLSDFYTKIENNSDSLWLEDVEFTNFEASLPKQAEMVMEPFLELKSDFVDKYSKHFIPKTGSVLGYLIQNREKIEPIEYNYLQNIALEDLRTTLYFYA